MSGNELKSTVIVLVIVFVVTLFSMILHELMHGLTAYWLGDDTAKNGGRLTLNPLKHIDPFLTILLPLIMAVMGGPIFGGAKPVPFNPSRVRGGEWGAALVGIAGPLTNLVLAFIFYVVYALLPASWSASPVGEIVNLFALYGVQVNLGFFAFNILPIPPLDGSRVLYAVAPEGVQRFMDVMERSLGLIVVFFIVLVASPIISQLMGWITQGVLTGFRFILAPFGIIWYNIVSPKAAQLFPNSYKIGSLNGGLSW